MRSLPRRPRSAAATAIAALAVFGFTALPASAGAAPNGTPLLPQPSGNGTCVPASVPAPAEFPWAQSLLAPSKAWPLADGHGVTVAVVDSGVQATAPQLGGQVEAGQDVTAAGGRGDRDCVGHGTFVAGLIAARVEPGSQLTGFAPGVRILPIRVTDADGAANAATLAKGIRAAADGGARVINVSVVSTLPSDDLAQAVSYAQQRGALVVAAAANDARLNNPVTYPAAYPGVVGVGAIDVSGSVAAYSEAGSFVDLVAPGSLVTSVGANGGYFAGNGTSFACPFVSATAALVWSYHPELTAAQVKARLEATANPPAPAEASAAGFGHGIVDPYAAVTSVLPVDVTPHAVQPSSPHLAAAKPPAAPARSQRLAALGSAGAAVALAVVGAALRIVVPRGRARGWRVTP